MTIQSGHEDVGRPIAKRNSKGKASVTVKTVTNADGYMRTLDPSNPPSDIVLNENQMDLVKAAGAEVETFKLADEGATPEIPLADERIENFLMHLVEGAYDTAADIYDCYKDAGFTLTGKRHQDMNSMRTLMRKPRVKDRWKFLQQSEWELTKPSVLSIKKRLTELVDSDIKPAELLAGIAQLAKLNHELEAKGNSQETKTMVIFNSCEAPKTITTSKDGNSITIESR